MLDRLLHNVRGRQEAAFCSFWKMALPIAMKFAKARPSTGTKLARARVNAVVGDSSTGRRVETVSLGDSIRYSSPWPWIVAVVLSVALWSLFGCLVWFWFFH